jgi:hypothetical protein
MRIKKRMWVLPRKPLVFFIVFDYVLSYVGYVLIGKVVTDGRNICKRDYGNGPCIQIMFCYFCVNISQ